MYESVASRQINTKTLESLLPNRLLTLDRCAIVTPYAYNMDKNKALFEIEYKSTTNLLNKNIKLFVLESGDWTIKIEVANKGHPDFFSYSKLIVDYQNSGISFKDKDQAISIACKIMSRLEGVLLVVREICEDEPKNQSSVIELASES